MMKQECGVVNQNSSQKRYINSNIQLESRRFKSLDGIYTKVLSSPMAGFKAFDVDGVYLISVEPRQPSIH
jgi:hypothetical protein